MFASVADLEKRMQKTTDHVDTGKEEEPCGVGRGPSVEVDAVGPVGGQYIAGLLGESAVGVGQRFGAGVESEGRAQNTVRAEGQGDIPFVAVVPGVFFISQQVLGEFVRVLNPSSTRISSNWAKIRGARFVTY
jgi:hypothetical protein